MIPILAASDNESEDANCSNKNFLKNLKNTGCKRIIPSTAMNESWKPAVNKSSGANTKIIVAASDSDDKLSYGFFASFESSMHVVIIKALTTEVANPQITTYKNKQTIKIMLEVFSFT